MGRNTADFMFGHEQTMNNLNYSPNKFERKLDNALGTRVGAADSTAVRVAPKEVGTTKKGFELRAYAGKSEKTASAPLPTRKRDINKSVNKLRKSVV